MRTTVSMLTQYGAQYPMRKEYDPTPNLGYFLMDWWFAARPATVATWLRIHDEWEFYEATLQRLLHHRAPPWSHYVWPTHVHDVLKMTAQIRFRDVQALIARRVDQTLLKDGQPLRECPMAVFQPSDRSTTSSLLFSTVMTSPLPLPFKQASELADDFPPGLAPMASMCPNTMWSSVGEIAEPVLGPSALVCCNRSCAKVERRCPAAVRHALWNVTAPIVEGAIRQGRSLPLL